MITQHNGLPSRLHCIFFFGTCSCSNISRLCTRGSMLAQLSTMALRAAALSLAFTLASVCNHNSVNRNFNFHKNQKCVHRTQMSHFSTFFTKLKFSDMPGWTDRRTNKGKSKCPLPLYYSGGIKSMSNLIYPNKNFIIGTLSN